MFKQYKRTLLCGILTVALCGCANMNNESTGRLAGGITGGLIGSTIGSGGGSVAAAVAGTLIGSMVGGSIGRRMDNRDRAEIYDGLEHNRARSWRSHDDTHYRTRPVRTYRHRGRQCRRIEVITRRPGQISERTVTTACRLPNGNWELMS